MNYYLFSERYTDSIAQCINSLAHLTVMETDNIVNDGIEDGIEPFRKAA